jgi:hypothetical protein
MLPATILDGGEDAELWPVFGEAIKVWQDAVAGDEKPIGIDKIRNKSKARNPSFKSK